MRLVHYYPRALVGDDGPTRAAWAWVNATHQVGCDVAILYDAALHAESPLRNPAIPLIPVRHTGSGRIRVPVRLGASLAPEDVLVLHSSYIPGNVRAAWSARRRGTPYIVVPHGGYNKRARERRHLRKQVWHPVERAYLERALAVHVFFQTETCDVAAMAPKARSIVSPTGFAPSAERWDGGSGGYIAWIGRYDIQTKGLDLLVHAMSRLSETDRRPLRTHGRPSEDCLDDLKRIASGAGLSTAVTIDGEISEAEKSNFLRRAVAYVHPSRWESHSLGLVEALAYGVPSVVSARCVIAPHLRAADAAVVVEPNPDDIARGISTVLRSAQQYSDRSTDFVRTSLSWNTIVCDYLQQIESLRTARRRSSLDAVGEYRP